MSNRQVVYNGAEFVYLTFRDWNLGFVRKGRTDEFSKVVYVGSRHRCKFDVDANENVMIKEVNHSNVRYWGYKFQKLVDVASRILEWAKPKDKIVVVCDEHECMFWRILKLTAETRNGMHECAGVEELIRSLNAGQGVMWCVVPKPRCKRELCPYKRKTLWAVRSLIVPFEKCIWRLNCMMSDVVDSWEYALREKEAFSDVLVELVCNV